MVAVAGVPGDPNVIYAGAAFGGVFKTTDGGVHWLPIFDDQQTLSICALVVACQSPKLRLRAAHARHRALHNGVAGERRPDTTTPCRPSRTVARSRTRKSAACTIAMNDAQPDDIPSTSRVMPQAQHRAHEQQATRRF